MNHIYNSLKIIRFKIEIGETEDVTLPDLLSVTYEG